jgi:hypothetical protein
MVQHMVDGQCERGLDCVVVDAAGPPEAEVLKIHCQLLMLNMGRHAPYLHFGPLHLYAAVLI